MLSVETFVESISARLLRAAWLLTGVWSAAEDLVQIALVSTWQHWATVQAQDVPEAYARRVLMNAFLRSRRRRWLGEHPVAEVPDQPGVDPYEVSGVRETLLTCLSRLPPRQRATVVLRYFLDLSEAQTADVLQCSVGNVKSQCSRALSKLRSMPDLRALLEETTHG